MIKFYVHKNQLDNFIYLKEPVKLENLIIDDNYYELIYPLKDVIIKTYRTYSTIELNTRKKRRKALWQKIIHKKH